MCKAYYQACEKGGEKMKKTEALSYFLVISFLIFLCVFFAVRLDAVNEEIQKLKQENVQIQKLVNDKCQETEGKCERMTDTCLDIISNQRWE